MDSVHRERLAALSGPWCGASLVSELLGIELEGDPRLAGAFRVWASRFRGPEEVERTAAGGLEVNRHAFETYLVQNGLISWNCASVYLGMVADVLRDVIARLEGMGVSVSIASGISDQLVRQREIAQLHRAFPPLRHRTFSDHSRMCRALHDAIRSELNVEVEPVTCVTSRILEPAEPDMAAAFDAITLQPVGLRYQVWLDTKKPVNLRPDVCSLRFYAQHEEDLRAHVLRGSEPDRIDERLRAA